MRGGATPGWWVTRLEQLVPLELRRDPVTRRRALLAVGFVAASVVVGAAIIPVLFFIEDPLLRFIAVFNTVLCVGLMALALVLLRRFRSLWLAGNWLCLMLYAGLIFSLSQGSGVRSPFTAVLTLLPVFGGIVSGRRTGVAWGAIAVVTIVVFEGLRLAGVELPDPNPPGVTALLTAGALVASLWLLTWMSSLSEAMKEETIQRIERASKQLEVAVAEEEKARIAADEAIAANTAKSTFLATMSHELRTPLNAILGYSEMVLDALAERGQAESEVAGDIRRVHAAGRHLLGLITDVLDIARIEAERMEIEATEFDPAPLLRELQEVFEPLARRNDDALRVDAPERLGAVFHDATRLRQILINLIGNAIKFTRDGTITLRGAGGDDWVELVVDDTGIGIPADKLDLVFEPFTQVDASRSRRYEGSGLGLAICHKLVELMGGSISATSTVGLGSSFTVRLPRRYSPPQRSPATTSGVYPR